MTCASGEMLKASWGSRSRRVALHELPVDVEPKRRAARVEQRDQLWRGDENATALIEGDEVARAVDADRYKFRVLIARAQGPAQQANVALGAARRNPRRDLAGQGAGEDIVVAAAAQPGHPIEAELQEIEHLRTAQ